MSSFCFLFEELSMTFFLPSFLPSFLSFFLSYNGRDRTSGTEILRIKESGVHLFVELKNQSKVFCFSASLLL